MVELSLIKISEVFDEWAKEMRIPTRDIIFNVSREKPNEITIYTDRPGIMIGKCGMLIEKYKQKFNLIIKEHNEIGEKIFKERGYNFKKMDDVVLNIIEVTRANYWLNYDPMSECM